MRIAAARVLGAVMVMFSATVLHAQSTQSSAPTAVPRLVHVPGIFVPANGQPASGLETVTVAIYAEEKEGTPLWEETQQVLVDSYGRYSILLGATRPDGLPLDLFASGEARWLGRRFERGGEREQTRVSSASIPVMVVLPVACDE